MSALGAWLKRPAKSSSPTIENCRNCGTKLVGSHCHACGQLADDFHRSVFKLITDSIGTLFNFDGRFWQTIPGLLFWPGRLSCRYINGERQKQIPPFRLFLVASLVFFLIETQFVTPQAAERLVNEGKLEFGGQTISDETRQEFQQLAETDIAGARQRIAELKGLAGFGVSVGPVVPKLEEIVQEAEAKAKAEADAKAQADAAAETVPPEAPAPDAPLPEASTQVPEPLAPPEPPLPAEKDPVVDALPAAAEAQAENGIDAELNITGPSTGIVEWLRDRLTRVSQKPDLFIAELNSWLPRVALLLPVLLALLLGLLYIYRIKRRMYMYDHLIVSLHLTAFWMVAASITVLVAQEWPPIIGWAVACALVHLVFHLRGAYRSGWFSASIKAFVVLLVAQLTIVLLILGAAGVGMASI